MGFKYNLAAVEILKRLGYKEPIGKESLIYASKKRNIKIPSILFDFLSLAENIPLLSTADLWTNRLDSFYFLYDEIDAWIDGDRECGESRVSNYLLIGSDYGAGVVQFGIRFTDIEQDNPPVYMHHECDSIADWRFWNNSLSSFLIQVLCDVLCCASYDTAVYVLADAGWTSRTLSQKDLSAYEIDTEAMLKQKSLYGINAMCGCAYEEERKQLLVAKIDESNGRTLEGIEYQKNDTR